MDDVDNSTIVYLCPWCNTCQVEYLIIKFNHMSYYMDEPENGDSEDSKSEEGKSDDASGDDNGDA